MYTPASHFRTIDQSGKTDNIFQSEDAMVLYWYTAPDGLRMQSFRDGAWHECSGFETQPPAAEDKAGG